MQKEDFYTGEVLDGDSPPISEEEAIVNADFGRYNYDIGYRNMINQQQYYQYTQYNGYPNYGYNGYCQYPQQQQQYYQYPQNNGYNYTYGFPYGGYNNYGYQQIYQQPQYDQPSVINIPPLNFSGEYMPNINFEQEIERLKTEYWMKEQEESVSSSNSSYGYGYSNYYGVPFYNNGYNSEASAIVEKMKEEARENRRRFNIHISTLVHNYLGDNCDPKTIEEMYTGKTIENPCKMTYQEYYDQQRFANLVPFDNSQIYRDFHAAVSKEFNDIIPADSDMHTFFLNVGVLNAQYAMEDEKHRRRDGAALYNSEDNSYKYFVRAKAAERYNRSNFDSFKVNSDQFINQLDDMKSSLLNNFSTLSQCATLSEDGTLNITCNFGSKAGENYSVHNSQEAGYDEDREKFNAFLNSIPGYVNYEDSPLSS